MYDQLESTQYPPKGLPLMVYDGNCGFCKYWIVKWKKLTKDSIEYAPYQEVSQQFKDISVDSFQSAVRLILPNGSIVSGPGAAYYSNQSHKIFSSLYKLYIGNTTFRTLSNGLYKWVADHRSFMYKLSVGCLGKNPERVQHIWIVYLILITLIVLSIANI